MTVATTLADIIAYPFKKIFQAKDSLTERVCRFMENYFKEIVFLFGTLVLIWKDWEAASLGACLGLFVPYSEAPSSVDEVNDQEKPFRVRFAAQLLLGAGFVLLHERYPAIRAFRMLAGIGGVAIGIGIKRFYLEVLAS